MKWDHQTVKALTNSGKLPKRFFQKLTLKQCKEILEWNKRDSYLVSEHGKCPSQFFKPEHIKIVATRLYKLATNFDDLSIILNLEESSGKSDNRLKELTLLKCHQLAKDYDDWVEMYKLTYPTYWEDDFLPKVKMIHDKSLIKMRKSHKTIRELWYLWKAANRDKKLKSMVIDELKKNKNASFSYWMDLFSSVYQTEHLSCNFFESWPILKICFDKMDKIYKKEQATK